MSDIRAFGEMLNALMDNGYYHNNSLISEKTSEIGNKVSVRNIQRYRARTVVPSLENAITLMKALDQNFTTDEVLESIALEKAEQDKYDKDTENSFDRNLTIRLSTIRQEVGASSITEFSKIVETRVAELYGKGQSAFNEYVRNLIFKDIKENILRKDNE